MGDVKKAPVVATQRAVAECKFGQKDWADYKRVEFEVSVKSDDLTKIGDALEKKARELAKIECGNYRVQNVELITPKEKSEPKASQVTLTAEQARDLSAKLAAEFDRICGSGGKWEHRTVCWK